MGHADIHSGFLELPEMSIKLTRILVVGLTLAVAACATTPPPAADLNPPPRKTADAKTQLESGRKY
ncbi:hypothetical protein [Microvirga thermotolerans]|uniref:Uncharacterized protein n=1 Tax=Microvirga thermotolerans TaxID=2651334 RepID=A0A5P9JYB6_9HYPH|nr:hypothetical protein [Microvirga thermotolerans]QFU16636.1 hypothetical protein GDR74_10560 [Microvirga thermotolerans]